MPKVSVIVPVFNTASFLADCFASLRGQTMEDFEVLLIENGSTDGSGSLCERAAAADKRFHVLYQKQPGVSAARNMGLDAATGDYIFFFDSDDALHPRTLEEMATAADANRAGLGVCGFQRVDDTQLAALMKDPPATDPAWQISRDETVERWFHLEHLSQFTCMGGKLIRRVLLDGLRFDEKTALGEDTLFLYQLASRRPAAVYSPQPWYYYRTREKSATHSLGLAKRPDYLRVSRLIRDSEYQKGSLDYALRWEIDIVWRIAAKSWEARRAKDQEGIDIFNRLAHHERQEPLYKKLPLFYKLFLTFRQFSFPVYSTLSNIIKPKV